MKKKVLMMGRSGAGKTSMRTVIFANYLPKNTKSIGATIDVEQSNVRFFGNLGLNIWDCGGQETFMENYYLSQRKNIFNEVDVLIYVFDVENSGDALAKDYESYKTCLEAISEYSPLAQIFCFVNKMDLIPQDQRTKVFLERQYKITNMAEPLALTCLKTSIWDETLYRAWSSMVHKLIPNMEELDRSLKLFADALECEEVLLFERTSFLNISSCIRVENRDKERIEKVSNIFKKFRLSCNQIAAKFDFMEIRNQNFALFIEGLTASTYIVIVMSDRESSRELISMNIKNTRKHFEELEHGSETQTNIPKKP